MRLPLSILCVAAFTQLGATDCGSIIKDPGFELWCGEELCSWKTLRGEVKQAITWHKSDTGVEMVGTDVAISQLTPVNSYDGTCILFELVANVEQNAEARLEIDVFGDGSIDHSERMPTSHWKALSYKLRIQAPYTGVRFVLSKKGAGRAVFAQIQADIAHDCEGLTEIVPAAAPLGAPCASDSRCESGMCAYVGSPGSFGANVCVACTATSCGTGQVCGLGEPLGPELDPPHTCVGVGTRELGEQCLVNGECESSTCNGGYCSTCTNNSCTGGELCGEAYANGPSLCNPGFHLRASTEPCATNSDCISNQCNGAVRKQCGDGRSCDSPADCPVMDDLEPGPCTAVGIQGGTCQ